MQLNAISTFSPT